MGKPLRDLTGQRFGFLVALRLGEKQRKDTGAWWLCRCDCGREKHLSGHDLVDGKIMSCGCQRRNLTFLAGPGTHGMRGSRTYRIWQAMLTRCRNPNIPQAKNYSGRGITVCERWLTFDNFLTDMGEAPAKHSIDRIDNNGNYEPTNCRWATSDQQMNNTRSNVFIEYQGLRLTRRQWERQLGLRPATIRDRLRRGLTVTEALKPLESRDGC